jgi:hypothetical protein
MSRSVGENDELSSSEINTELKVAHFRLPDRCRSSTVDFCTDLGVGGPGLRGTHQP